ncbi:MAG: GIY-YIG nuclease family protein [Phycisphaerae bacterium]|nr:GIY-YIG nuclease family protein [Phycisphaerae bacterium]
MSERVTYKEMARRLDVAPSTVRRLIDRHGAELGISIQKGRANTSNAKWTHYITREDADHLAAFYETRHTQTDITSESEPYQRQGFFYVIQLVPEALPNRIKIGYTDNLEKRLTEHQTAAPTARVLASWPCKRSWDYAAMDSITREGCSLVLNEVFEGDPDGFVQRGNDFFSLMPSSDAERVLSEHSPLHQDDTNDEEDDT